MCGMVGIAGPHELKRVHDMNGANVHRGCDENSHLNPDGVAKHT